MQQVGMLFVPTHAKCTLGPSHDLFVLTPNERSDCEAFVGVTCQSMQGVVMRQKHLPSIRSARAVVWCTCLDYDLFMSAATLATLMLAACTVNIDQSTISHPHHTVTISKCQWPSWNVHEHCHDCLDLDMTARLHTTADCCKLCAAYHQSAELRALHHMLHVYDKLGRL